MSILCYQNMSRSLRWFIGAILLVSYQGSGCGFIESAGELTFGEGQIPLLENEFQYPSVNQIANLDQTEEVVPGFPSSLEKSTLAHLVGALSAQGECGQQVDLVKHFSASATVAGVWVCFVAASDGTYGW